MIVTSPATSNFKSSDVIFVAGVTNSSAVVGWTTPRSVADGLGDRYYSVLFWQADGETGENKQPVNETADVRSEVKITGLRYNTKYYVWLQPYRRHNGHIEEGNPTDVTPFRTACNGTGSFIACDVI